MNCNKIKTELEIQKINNLLDITDYMSDELQIYLSKLSNLTSESETNYSENFKNSEIIPNDVSSLFKKPWNKLPIVHQIIKIKEYCKQINNNKAKCFNMEKNLIHRLKKRDLKSINYDEENGKIICISDINKKID